MTAIAFIQILSTTRNDFVRLAFYELLGIGTAGMNKMGNKNNGEMQKIRGTIDNKKLKNRMPNLGKIQMLK